MEKETVLTEYTQPTTTSLTKEHYKDWDEEKIKNLSPNEAIPHFLAVAQYLAQGNYPSYQDPLRSVHRNFRKYHDKKAREYGYEEDNYSDEEHDTSYFLEQTPWKRRQYASKVLTTQEGEQKQALTVLEGKLQHQTEEIERIEREKEAKKKAFQEYQKQYQKELAALEQLQENHKKKRHDVFQEKHIRKTVQQISMQAKAQNEAFLEQTLTQLHEKLTKKQASLEQKQTALRRLSDEVGYNSEAYFSKKREIEHEISQLQESIKESHEKISALQHAKSTLNAPQGYISWATGTYAKRKK